MRRVSSKSVFDFGGPMDASEDVETLETVGYGNFTTPPCCRSLGGAERVHKQAAAKPGRFSFTAVMSIMAVGMLSVVIMTPAFWGTRDSLAGNPPPPDETNCIYSF